MAQSVTMKEAFFSEEREQILFCSFLILCPDFMRLPLKNRLSGFTMVVFQVLFLLYLVKSYQRRLNFISDCQNNGFQTFATITASLRFMGTTSLKLGVLRITWRKMHTMVVARTAILLTVHPILYLEVSLCIHQILPNVFTPLRSCPALFQFLQYLVHCFS